eukprot:Gb_24022 [translate_table: standard]
MRISETLEIFTRLWQPSENQMSMIKNSVKPQVLLLLGLVQCNRVWCILQGWQSLSCFAAKSLGFVLMYATTGGILVLPQPCCQQLLVMKASSGFTIRKSWRHYWVLESLEPLSYRKAIASLPKELLS